jgi:hypothetical protein
MTAILSMENKFGKKYLFPLENEDVAKNISPGQLLQLKQR